MENLYVNPDEIIVTDPKVDEYIAKERQRVLGFVPVAQTEDQRRAKTVSWVRPGTAFVDEDDRAKATDHA